ncbi:MAG: hypothetical protein IJA12_05795 [Oscillospiraceae bacterium]|nr:hypothetical protein [Oscillospiraceae bacterium]
MNPKLLKYIIIMTVIVVLVWIAGEVLIVAVMKLSGVASIIWSVAMLIAAIVLSLYKSFKSENDKNDRNW